jgi:hypothetical protein
MVKQTCIGNDAQVEDILSNSNTNARRFLRREENKALDACGNTIHCGL